MTVRQDLVTVIGSTTSVSAGEHLEATGKWVVDRQHGQQFKADELKTTHPASAEGIEKHLASGAIRSIGPKPNWLRQFQAVPFYHWSHQGA
jgi:exodeoxyribonuclease V alpha subunit